MLHLVAVPAICCIAAPEAHTLALTVAEGTTLTKTFTSTLDVELDEIELTLDAGGEVRDLDAPEIEATIQEVEEIVITDEYLAVEDGVATRVRRRYDDLSNVSSQSITSPEGESSDEDRSGTSALDGRVVLHTWDAGTEEWEYAFDDDEDGDAGLLEELEQWADLVSFLPDGEVEVGDEWELPLEAFLHLSSPCGDLHFVRDGEEDDDSDASEQFRDNLDGEVVARLASVEGGLATLALRIEVTTSTEEDEDVPEEAGDVEATRGMEFEFDLEGTLVWSLEGGHLVSAEVGGDVELAVSNRQEGAQGGVDFVFLQVQHFVGTLTLTAEVE